MNHELEIIEQLKRIADALEHLSGVNAPPPPVPGSLEADGSLSDVNPQGTA